MAKLTSKEIRNVALVGHSSAGKTSLAEAMLYLTKATDRLGNPADGNTVCDFDDEEIKRGLSISTSVAPVMWNGIKINLLDAPGYLDFIGEVYQTMRVADAAMIVVDGKAGVEVGTELAWQQAEEAGIPRAFYINKFDDGEARFKRVYTQLRETFGVSVCPILIPMIEGDKVVGFLNLINMRSVVYDKNGVPEESPIPADFEDIAAEYRDMLLESIAQTSDELMEKYFGGEEITYDEAVLAVHEGIIAGDIVPVYCGSATKFWGIRMLMDQIADSFPRPTAKKEETVVVEDMEDTIAIEPDGTTSVFVFKTISDPFVGKMSFFKVMNGELNNSMVLRNTTTGQQEKFGHIYTMTGKKQTEVDALCCGDIGMIPKLANTNTNDTLTLSADDIKYAPIKFPQSFMKRAIQPKAKGDEDKISSGIAKLLEEDRTLSYENNAETNQMCISGQGDIHLDVIVSKLKNRFGTSVELTKPKVAYRETIKKTVQVEGKHKKQSGGSGQYGHVKVTFSRGEEDGLTFTTSVVGGTVPKNFYPAVQKGLEEAMEKGVLAGFPVVGLKADLFDGSYHPVDSNEISFKLAAKLAYKEGLPKAGPVILEPIGKLCVYVPDSMIGDIIGGVSKSRGTVLGMTPTERKGEQMVEAEVPVSEMTDYPITLRAMTQGRGRFTFEFDRYEEAPAEVAQKIIEERKAEMEE
ncbi:MAG: elongation factor G [Clostridia bacterium]|nr:elongation factor G [Clostridia bacterium]